MRTLMSGDVWVHYRQAYVQSGYEFPDLDHCFGGQQNGLCGAAEPGVLYLITGLHTGEVGFAVELHEEPPPVDETWEEIVEVSFRPTGEVSLVGWGGHGHWPLELTERDYRVRYCGTRMEEARTLDTRGEGSEVDRYLLQFWPGPPEPDRVVKQTSATAAYWHGVARRTPPPPTAEERAVAERHAQLEREREAAEARLKFEERGWGGTLPSDRLRELRGNALSVAELDRPLVDALAEADPAIQREIARWVTRRAFVEAQLADVDWIAPALAAMDRGEPLPSPFDQDSLPWDRLFADDRVPTTLVTSPDGRTDNCLQQAMAFPALSSAVEQDPLRAATDALWAAAVAFGHGRHEVVFAEVRHAFPAVFTT
ncbi:hypothetical protein D5S17_31300 [Pseudonocardiaceae bacterium YIM PH 21723]|nr:hypothetical protein D5S17_31300 [Pseudonocardiaceae bacterium YIM PH 21723]